MATTQFADIYVPRVYDDLIPTENRIEELALLRSGLVIQNQRFNALARGSNIGAVRFWNDLNRTEPNISTDDPADVAVPDKITMGLGQYRVHNINYGWSVADLTADILGRDPMQEIRNLTAGYWNYHLEQRVIASLQGVLADNIANDSSDMVVDVSGTNLENNTDDTHKLSRDLVLAAAMTSGDQFRRYNTIIVHPAVYDVIAKDVVQVQQTSDGQRPSFIVERWMGLNVVVSDALPVTPAEGALDADDAAKYTSILCGRGTILAGDGTGALKTPSALERKEDQGNGAGVETLWERKAWIIHPNGFSFLDANLTDNFSSTLAQLRLATNWNRVVARRRIPLAFMIHNI